MDDAYTSRLSDYMDDEDLDAAERADIESHLASCTSCRQTLAELRGVTARARSLADKGPERNLWPAIARQIAATRVVQFGQRASRRIAFTIPQLVAAGLALMVLSGAMVWVWKMGGARTDIPPAVASNEPPRATPVGDQPRPANFADREYEAAIADLQKALDAGRNRLDPQTVRVLEENLLAIDRAIEQSRRALEQDPANLFLNTHLAAARSHKLAVLRSATALVANRSEL